MTKYIEFQIIDWNSHHELENNENDTDDYDMDNNEIEQVVTGKEKFIIRLFGTTRDNKKVFAKIENFRPYFYVELSHKVFNSEKWCKNSKCDRKCNCRKYMICKRFIEIVKNLAYYKYRETLVGYEIVYGHKFIGFTNYKKYAFLKLIFSNYLGFKAFERVFYKPIEYMKQNIRLELFETNIEPIFRFMHIQGINSCGFVKIENFEYINNNKPSFNEINIRVNWDNVTPVKDSTILPLMIAAFDIECTSGDGTFPQAHRPTDKVITIGTVFNIYGNSECFYKHVITLGSCDSIEGVDVESYDTEKQVFLAWTKLINRMNPDVITGYNIFGFDFKYLEARSKLLNCDIEFSKLSRLKNEPCKFIFKDLSSAAYGKNHFYFYDIIGRIQVDLHKVIQREHKLGSYRLDNVAAFFMREVIKNIRLDLKKNRTYIITNNTYGLFVGRYIKITYNDGLSDNSYKDDKKFRIIELDDKNIVVDGIIDELDVKKYETYWCNAKDDVKPYELFELQKGSSKDRAIIAEYCIQDCILCNQLLEKLQILTNNISMANVCHVPLTYIFLRGQGIKILSLVSKKCRERNHILPVLRKKKDFECDDINDGYEGATVLYPNVGYHQYQVTTWDYSSLYPSSMIHRNISHECLVMSDQYMNLDDYIYYTVYYYEKSGKEILCRYAKKKDSTLIGILPEILQDLLRERSITRKLGALEKDKFKSNIYEGLQLAYKITANSLYGQTGAKTSAIYLKQIAASTTATGREMLNCARLFSEYIYPKIVNSIIQQDYELYVKQMELLFNKQIDTFLGKHTVTFLKKNKYKDTIDPQDTSYLSKPSDYFYLRVFQEKFGIFDENKLKYKKDDINIETKNDFLKWFYDDIYSVMKNKTMKPKCVYGDTDSVFVNFGISDEECTEFITDDRAVKLGIDMGKLGERLINLLLPPPQNLAYEKTFWPYILLSKKRYVGNLYEDDPNKFYQKSMGIVLKRRDNAPIVKIVVGGIVDKLLNEHSPQKAVEFTKKALKDILCEKYGIDKFIISKTLKGSGMTQDEFNKENESYDEFENISNLIENIENIIKTFNDKNFKEKLDIISNIVKFIGGMDVINYDMIPELSINILYYIKKIGIILSDKETKNYKRIVKEKTKGKYIVHVTDIVFRILSFNKPVNIDCLHSCVLATFNKQLKFEHIRENNKNIFKQPTGITINKHYNDILDKLKNCKREVIVNIGPQLIICFEQIKKTSVYKPYVDRTRIVHAVLADRMSLRDPGNKPQSNDRIPYVYVITENDVEVQGDRVEHPDFVIEHNLKIDYLFYITNQIMKPAIQILETMIHNPQIIFDSYINRELNRRSGKKPINFYFNNTNNDDGDYNKKTIFDCHSENVLEKHPINTTIKQTVKKNPKKISVKKNSVKKNSKKTPVKKTNIKNIMDDDLNFFN
jgi:DNA polymerase elongation subunit (family B)